MIRPLYCARRAGQHGPGKCESIMGPTPAAVLPGTDGRRGLLGCRALYLRARRGVRYRRISCTRCDPEERAHRRELTLGSALRLPDRETFERHVRSQIPQSTSMTGRRPDLHGCEQRLVAMFAGSDITIYHRGSESLGRILCSSSVLHNCWLMLLGEACADRVLFHYEWHAAGWSISVHIRPDREDVGDA